MDVQVGKKKPVQQTDIYTFNNLSCNAWPSVHASWSFFPFNLRKEWHSLQHCGMEKTSQHMHIFQCDYAPRFSVGSMDAVGWFLSVVIFFCSSRFDIRSTSNARSSFSTSNFDVRLAKISHIRGKWSPELELIIINILANRRDETIPLLLGYSILLK